MPRVRFEFPYATGIYDAHQDRFLYERAGAYRWIDAGSVVALAFPRSRHRSVYRVQAAALWFAGTDAQGGGKPSRAPVERETGSGVGSETGDGGEGGCGGFCAPADSSSRMTTRWRTG